MDTDRAAPLPARLVFVTGPGGAGRTTAIHALEDLGFEAIVNLPLGLVPRLLDGVPPDRSLALGTDPRNRDFGAARLVEIYEALAADTARHVDLVYLDCDPATLLRRYSETRRRHPMAPDAAPTEGIALERELLAPVRRRASVLIDTSDLTPHDLRAEMQRLFAPQDAAGLSVTVTSFSYRRGLPAGADLVFDCRFLRNPHWAAKLRERDGRDPEVVAHIAEDPRFAPFAAQVEQMLDLLIPAYRDEGKSHLTIAFGCTGGKHRSVALAELTAARLAEDGWQVSKRHREVERQGDPATGSATSAQREAQD